MVDIDTPRNKFLKNIKMAGDLDQLNAVRVDALGKKGAISVELGKLGQMDAEVRKKAGQIINALKHEIIFALSERQKLLAKQALDKKLEAEKVDVSLPSRPSLSLIHI